MIVLPVQYFAAGIMIHDIPICPESHQVDAAYVPNCRLRSCHSTPIQVFLALRICKLSWSVRPGIKLVRLLVEPELVESVYMGCHCSGPLLWALPDVPRTFEEINCSPHHFIILLLRVNGSTFSRAEELIADGTYPSKQRPSQSALLTQIDVKKPAIAASLSGPKGALPHSPQPWSRSRPRVCFNWVPVMPDEGMLPCGKRQKPPGSTFNVSPT